MKKCKKKRKMRFNYQIGEKLERSSIHTFQSLHIQEIRINLNRQLFAFSHSSIQIEFIVRMTLWHKFITQSNRTTKQPNLNPFTRHLISENLK